MREHSPLGPFSVESGGTRTHAVTERYRVGIQLEGPRQGRTGLEAVATAQSLTGAERVEVELFAFDVASLGAAAGRGATFDAPGVRRRIIGRTEGTLATPLREPLDMSMPGLWRLAAVVRRQKTNGEDDARTRSPNVSQVAVSEVMLRVEANGDAYWWDPAQSESERRVLGRVVFDDSTRVVDQATMLPSASSQSCGPYRGTARYVNFDSPNNVTTPAIANAEIVGEFQLISESGPAIPFATTTDSVGEFQLSAHAGRRFIGSIRLRNNRVRVHTSGGVNETSLAVSDLCSAPASHFVAVSAAGKVWATVNTAALRAESRFARTRTELRVDLAGSNGATYISSGDRVEVASGIVWEDEGTFIIAHEYGHAFQYGALGGIPSPSGCGSYHAISGAYTIGCAYVEGFANFFAAFLFDDILSAPFTREFFEQPHGRYLLSGLDFGFWCLNQSRAQFLASECPARQFTSDGALSELAVAAFLYDLVDGPDTQNGSPGVDDDALQLPLSWIGDVIASCEVSERGAWRRMTGADHLIYCTERSLGGHYAAGYFPTRADWPMDWRTSVSVPVNWSLKGVRAAWKSNLFVHGPPGPVPPPPPPPPPPVGNTGTLIGPSVVGSGETCTWSVSTSVPDPTSFAWTINGTPVGQNGSTVLVSTPVSSFTLSVVVTNANFEGVTVSLLVNVQAGGNLCLDQ